MKTAPLHQGVFTLLFLLPLWGLLYANGNQKDEQAARSREILQRLNKQYERITAVQRKEKLPPMAAYELNRKDRLVRRKMMRQIRRNNGVISDEDYQEFNDQLDEISKEIQRYEKQ